MRRHLQAILAGVVVASFVGVAQSGEISSETDYDAAMKEVDATFGAVQSDMDARDGEAVIAGTTKLTELFGQVEAFWESHNVPAVAAIATQAGEAASAIRSEVENQAFQEIVPARDALAGACQACHNEYREPVDGGGFRLPLTRKRLTTDPGTGPLWPCFQRTSTGSTERSMTCFAK